MSAAADLHRNLIQRVNLGDSLRRSASLYQDKAAIIDDVRTITYRQLHREANAMARFLVKRNVARRDIVALLFRNQIDFFVAYFACARIGAAALPLNPQLDAGGLAYILGETEPVALIALGDYCEVATELVGRTNSIRTLVVAGCADGSLVDLPSISGVDVVPIDVVRSEGDDDVELYVEDRDTLQCIYTSGTTGSPKGVMTSHVAATLTALSAAHHARINDADTGLVLLPIHHVGGLNDSAIPHLVVGATIVLVDGWSPSKVARLFERYLVTDAVLTAPMWIELLRFKRTTSSDWSAMRACLIGIASLSPEWGAELRLACPAATLLMASGQTEFTGYEEGQRPEHQFTKPLAWGDPTLMTDIAVMSDEGELLSPNEVGEIVYRGPQAMTGYFGQAALTEESFKFGWFHSGDLGYLDDDHTLFFVDRMKDMIKTGGENVASIEVTHAIIGHPAVADCAVVGLPHQRWTEAITAFVQVAEGTAVTGEEIVAYCRERLVTFKLPKKVVFVDEFPRTASGKIQKVQLRQDYARIYDEHSL